MPYIEVTDEQLREFDPEGKLKIYEPEDVTGLKNTANALLGEKKALEAKLAQQDADLKAAKLAKPSSDSSEDVQKLQSQLDDAMMKIGDWEGKYNGLQGEIKSKTIETEAVRIATSMTSDTNRANLLKQQILSRLTLDGDKFSVLDENGSPTISSIDELTGQIKAQYPFLVDGSQASGGGARGGSGGAAPAMKKFDQYNAGELSTIKRETPEVYDRLKTEYYGTGA